MVRPSCHTHGLHQTQQEQHLFSQMQTRRPMPEICREFGIVMKVHRSSPSVTPDQCLEPLGDVMLPVNADSRDGEQVCRLGNYNPLALGRWRRASIYDNLDHRQAKLKWRVHFVCVLKHA